MCERVAEFAVVVGPGTVRLERLLPGPVGRVWAYLTDPALRATWLAGGPMELRVGGLVDLVYDHALISSEGPKTRLILTRQRLASDGDVIDAATGWHAHVDILEDRVSGRTPRLFWATHERLEEDYRRRLPPQLAF
jgi:hypothetical protein